MRWFSASLLLLSACGGSDRLVSVATFGASPRPEVVPTVFVQVDSGTPAPRGGAFVGPFGPPCCDPAGRRLTSATCTGGECSCSVGELCLCTGAPAAFICSDFCGSDAFVDAECTAEGWTCGAGLVKTDSCAAGTCWGEPGECCVNPSCVDGEWQCSEIADGGGCW